MNKLSAFAFGMAIGLTWFVAIILAGANAYAGEFNNLFDDIFKFDDDPQLITLSEETKKKLQKELQQEDSSGRMSWCKLNSIFIDRSLGCIDGSCENGKGTCTGTDGYKYVGEFKNGKRHGYGIRTKGDISYEGEWKEDMMHGMAILINRDQTMKFIGNFINNQQNGEGTLISIEPEYTVQGNFDKFSLIGEGQILLDGKSHKVILTDGKYTWKE